MTRRIAPLALLAALAACSTPPAAIDPSWIPDKHAYQALLASYADFAGPPQLIVRLRDETRARVVDDRLATDEAAQRAAVDAVNTALERHHLLRLERLFDDRPVDAVEREREQLRDHAGVDPGDLNLFFVATLEQPGGDRLAAARAVNALDAVAIAYARLRFQPMAARVDGAGELVACQGRCREQTPCKSDCNADGPLRACLEQCQQQSPAQDHLGALRASDSWCFAGGRGEGIAVYTLGERWSFDHRALAGAQLRYLGDRPEVARTSSGPPSQRQLAHHGTACLSLLVGADAQSGLSGVAPAASAVAVDVTSRHGVGQRWDVAAAIRAATGDAAAGDVIHVPLGACSAGYGPRQACRDNPQCGCLPVELDPAVRAAVGEATAKGIAVVIAAGNGGQDLDHAGYQGLFSREHDTGAIYVAALGLDRRSPAPWTNYGSRVDLHGYGSGVVAAGYGNLGDAPPAKTPRRPVIAVHGYCGTAQAMEPLLGGMRDSDARFGGYHLSGTQDHLQWTAGQFADPGQWLFSFDYYVNHASDAAGSYTAGVGRIGSNRDHTCPGGGNGHIVGNGAYDQDVVHEYAGDLAAFVESVLRATGADEVDIIAHSMGGVVTRSYLSFYGGAQRVRRVLLMGSPVRGVSGLVIFGLRLLGGGANPGWMQAHEEAELNDSSRDFHICGGSASSFGAALEGHERSTLPDVELHVMSGDADGLIPPELANHPLAVSHRVIPGADHGLFTHAQAIERARELLGGGDDEVPAISSGDLTGDFGGTSAASATIAGLVATLQGAARQSGKSLDPRCLRGELAASGVPQALDRSRPIGALPRADTVLPRVVDLPPAPAAIPSCYQQPVVDCQSGDDCGSGLCQLGSGGGGTRCATPCARDSECPAGETCAPASNGRGEMVGAICVAPPDPVQLACLCQATANTACFASSYALGGAGASPSAQQRVTVEIDDDGDPTLVAAAAPVVPADACQRSAQVRLRKCSFTPPEQQQQQSPCQPAVAPLARESASWPLPLLLLLGCALIAGRSRRD